MSLGFDGLGTGILAAADRSILLKDCLNIQAKKPATTLSGLFSLLCIVESSTKTSGVGWPTRKTRVSISDIEWPDLELLQPPWRRSSSAAPRPRSMVIANWTG